MTTELPTALLNEILRAHIACRQYEVLLNQPIPLPRCVCGVYFTDSTWEEYRDNDGGKPVRALCDFLIARGDPMPTTEFSKLFVGTTGRLRTKAILKLWKKAQMEEEGRPTAFTQVLQIVQDHPELYEKIEPASCR